MTQQTTQDAHETNRLREIRHVARQQGYLCKLHKGYSTEDLDIAATELSSIIETHNEDAAI